MSQHEAYERIVAAQDKAAGCPVCWDWAYCDVFPIAEHHPHCPVGGSDPYPWGIAANAEAVDLVTTAGYPSIPCGAD